MCVCVCVHIIRWLVLHVNEKSSGGTGKGMILVRFGLVECAQISGGKMKRNKLA